MDTLQITAPSDNSTLCKLSRSTLSCPAVDFLTKDKKKEKGNTFKTKTVPKGLRISFRIKNKQYAFREVLEVEILQE